jgi:hypothetical protein
MILISSAGNIYLTTKKHWLCDFTEEFGRNQVQKINKAMKDIELPKFDTPDNFVNLCNIVESNTKQYLLWVEGLVKVANTMPGKVQIFMEHPIRSQTMLQQLNTSLVKY